MSLCLEVEVEVEDLCVCALIRKRADLEADVTDAGLRELAAAGCGENLMSLVLDRTCCFSFFLCDG